MADLVACLLFDLKSSPQHPFAEFQTLLLVLEWRLREAIAHVPPDLASRPTAVAGGDLPGRKRREHRVAVLYKTAWTSFFTMAIQGTTIAWSSDETMGSIFRGDTLGNAKTTVATKRGDRPQIHCLIKEGPLASLSVHIDQSPSLPSSDVTVFTAAWLAHDPQLSLRLKEAVGP